MDNYVNINSESVDFLGLLTECCFFSSSEMRGNSRIVLPNNAKRIFAVLKQTLANSNCRSALVCHAK